MERDVYRVELLEAKGQLPCNEFDVHFTLPQRKVDVRATVTVASATFDDEFSVMTVRVISQSGVGQVERSMKIVHSKELKFGAASCQTDVRAMCTRLRVRVSEKRSEQEQLQQV